MNNRIAKKIRKETKKQIKFDLNELDQYFNDKSFLERIKIAFKIIFKYRVYKTDATSDNRKVE